MDEIDQSVLAKRGEHPGDGSTVKADLRSMLFTFLGDIGDQGGLAVLGMTNRPDLLDEASIDRFSKIPILHATFEEAAHIMAIQARREQRELDLDAAAEALAASGDVFSGRQLVLLLESARIHAREHGHARIEGDDVSWAIHDALERIGAGEERMALLAVASTSYNRHLPWNAARYLGDSYAQPPKYLEPFVFGDGTVDLEALRARIREMEHHAR
jgi:AAA+ superfamily predicted ATPase